MFGRFRRHNEPVVAPSASTSALSMTYVRLASLINLYPRRVELAPTDKALLREVWSNPPAWTIILPPDDAPVGPSAPPHRPQPHPAIPSNTGDSTPVTGGPAW